MEIDRPLPAQPSDRDPGEVRVAGVTSEDTAYWEGLEHTDEFRQLIRARMRFVLPATAFWARTRSSAGTSCSMRARSGAMPSSLRARALPIRASS